jgi:uncharacterized Tic20 family protein
MEDNNEFDWQGKKKENVEFSYTMFFWSTIICIVLLLGLSLTGILEYLFK